jgi:hypothetical protein
MTLPTKPADLTLVLSAARLGWNVAELRGRLRPQPTTQVRSTHPRDDSALPLGAERTNLEKSIELEAAIGVAAEALHLDPDASKLSGEARDESGSASDRFTALSRALAKARKGDSQEVAKAAWERVADFFYAWDAKIQDGLVSEPHQSAAYQLGRGVAEIRWALDPTVQDDSDWRSWEFLLSPKRGRILDSQLARLTDYYDPTTRHALSSSMKSWRAVVATRSNRSAPATITDVQAQAFIWRDLIVGDSVGSSLVAPADILSRPGSFAPVFRHLWPEATVLGLGSLLLLIGASLVSSTGSQTMGAVVGLLGILGVSGAALATRARATAIDLLSQIHEQLYFDIAADQAFVGPGTRSRLRRSEG